MTVEEILQQSGDFGPAQWWLLSLFCVTNIISAFHYFAQTFVVVVPPNFCVEGFSNCTAKNYSTDCIANMDSGWDGLKYNSLTIEVRKT